jgi:hypothetical protein
LEDVEASGIAEIVYKPLGIVEVKSIVKKFFFH